MDKVLKKRKEVVATTATEVAGSDKNRPVKTFREVDVSAAVWARTIVQLEPRTLYSISIERSYQNARGEWQYTNFYSPGDGQKLMTVWKQAVEFVEELQRQDAADHAAGEQDAE